MLGRGDNGVVVDFPICLKADQRPFAAREVVFDNEIGAAAAVEGEQQVVAAARGVNAHRACSGCSISELVVRAVNGFDLFEATAFQPVLGDGLFVGVFQGEGDGCHAVFLCLCRRLDFGIYTYA